MERYAAVGKRIACATPASGRVFKLWYEKRGYCLAVLTIIAIGAFMAVPLAQAHAFDIVEEGKKLINSWAEGPMKAAYNVVVDNCMYDQITNPFSQLLGTANAYGAVQSVSNTVIQPIGRGVVGICAMIQMAQIGSRFDSNGVAVEVREVFFLMIYCVVFFYLIDNSFTICQGMYDWSVTWVTKVLDGFGGSQIGLTEDDFSKMIDGYDAVPILKLLVGILMFLAALLASIVVWVVTTARYLQIYLFTLVAPIPLAFLAQDETRQWGTGFIKNYLALCLAGLFLAAIIGLFPALISSVGGNLIAALGVIILYIFALIKSGSWARDILGG